MQNKFLEGFFSDYFWLFSFLRIQKIFLSDEFDANEAIIWILIVR